MTLNPKTKNIIINYFRKRPEVAAVYLYGSQARGEAKPDSDIDLAVLLSKDSPPIMPHVEYSSDLIQLTHKEVEVQDLKLVSIDFAQRVLSEGKLFLSNNDRERIVLEESIARKYFDMKPALEEYYRYLSEIAKRGELHVRYT